MNWLPAHKASLHLTHNEHRDYYISIEQWETDYSVAADEWVSPGERQRAIEQDSVWRLQWYPDTPIGFCVLCASTLEALEAHFRENPQG